MSNRKGYSLELDFWRNTLFTEIAEHDPSLDEDTGYLLCIQCVHARWPCERIHRLITVYEFLYKEKEEDLISLFFKIPTGADGEPV